VSEIMGYRSDRAPLYSKSPFDLRVDLASDVPDATIRTSLADGDMGFLHSFTTGSRMHGPGFRLVAWSAGCNWRCAYCYNPDTWNMRNGMLIRTATAIEELRRYRFWLKIMCGGFTLSGGEPLVQHRFAVKLLKAARTMGIHTALDTNGSLGSQLSDEELDTVNLFLLDIKAWNVDRHRLLTGADIGPVLGFARRLAKRKKPVWLRFVLVPGVTDDEQDIVHLAAFAAELANIERVDVLPFHQLGRWKWEQLRMEYSLKEVGPPSAELIERACEHFRAAGLNVANPDTRIAPKHAK
jgi:pyruvate formate lyase activating enzyme